MPVSIALTCSTERILRLCPPGTDLVYKPGTLRQSPRFEGRAAGPCRGWKS